MKFRPTVPESRAIAARRELLRGGETIRGIVFQSVDRALRAELGPEVAADVQKGVGLSVSTLDTMSKLPMLDFLTYEEAAATRLKEAGFGTLDESVHRIGAAAVDSFFDSIAGRTMALLAGKDPTRLLSAVPNGYGLLVSYGSRTWRQTGPGQGEFVFAGEFLGPIHNLGTFDAALKLVHDVDVDISLRQSSPVDFTFLMSW